MADFFFNLQRFADTTDGKITLSANETFTFNGVDYKSGTSGVVLKATTTETDGTYTATAITGINSGTVTASPTGKTDPAITFDGTTAFDFICTAEDGALNVKKGKSSLNYTTGTVTYYADELDIPQGIVGFSGTLMNFLPFNVTMTVPASGIVETLDGSGGATFSASDKVSLQLTFPEGVAKNLEEIKSYLPTILKNHGIEITAAQVDTLYNIVLPIVRDSLELSFKGAINYTSSPTSISFGENTTTDVTIGERTISFETVDGAAGIGFTFADGVLTITPGSNDGTLDITAKNGDIKTFAGNIEVSGGSIAVDVFKQNISVTAGTKTTVTLSDDIAGAGGRSFAITAEQGSSSTFAIGEDGKITLTPADENPLHIKVTNDTATAFERDIMLKGPVVIGMDDNTFTVKKDTALTFSGEYGDKTIATTLTATDDAGITLDIDSDGVLTLTPGENDGSLDLTIKQGGEEIFSNTLEISDGSITFDTTNSKIIISAGTKITFERDEQKISFTATEDISASYYTDAENILYIALDDDAQGDISITRGERTITGTFSAGGVLSYNAQKGTFGLTGANSSHGDGNDTFAQITLNASNSKTYSVRTATDGETLVLIPKIVDGNFELNFPNERKDTLIFTFSKNGQPILSNKIAVDGTLGIKTASQEFYMTEGTSVRTSLGDYSITATANDDTGVKISVDNGKITFTAEKAGSLDLITQIGDTELFKGTLEFSAGSAGSIDLTTGELSLLKGTTTTIYNGDYSVSVTATDDAGTFIMIVDGKIMLTPGENDGSLDLTIKQGGEEIFSGNVKISGGSIVIDNSTQEISLTKDTTVTVTIGDYTVELTALDDAGINFDIDGEKLTITPQGDGGSTHIAIKNGDRLVLENTIGLSSGSISVDFANQQLAIAEGTKLALEQSDGDATINLTAKNDVVLSIVEEIPPDFDPDNPPAPPEDSSPPPARPLYFTIENGSASFDVDVERNGTELFNSTVTVGGTIGYYASTNTFGLMGSDSFQSDKDSYIEITTGEYTFKASTDGETATNSFSVSDDGKITVTFPDDERNGLKITATRSGSELFSGYVNIDGSIVYDTVSNKFIVPADTITTVTIGDYSAVLMVTDDAGFTIDAGSGKTTLTPGDGDGKLITTIFNSDDTAIFGGIVEVANGSIVFDGNKLTTSVTKGTTTTITIGERSIALTANDDAGVNFSVDGGKLKITPQDGDGSIDVVYSEGGEVAFKNNVEISGGSITFDATTNKVGLTKDTTITLSQPDDSKISVTALDDAAIAISAADGGGVRIAPDSGDGDLQISVTRDGFTRTATLGIEGAVVYQRGGNISLEEDTTVDLKWEDGYEVAITSRGSSGTIAFDPEKGLGVTSTDDKLDVKLTTPAGSSFTYGSIQGTLWYNSGKITLTEGTSLKSTGTLLRDDVEVAFEAVGGDIYAEFHTYYFIYGAGTGTFKLTLTDTDSKTGTINLSEGALKIGKDTGGFVIAEGTTISTDLTSGITQLFTTGAAGNYVINGHKLTTTTEGVKITATSDGMVLAVSDAVTCDGLTFTGGGSVTLTADGKHIIGAGVSIADFDAGESFVLTTAGSVTADGKTFELTDDVEEGITVTAAQDGYIIDSHSYGTEQFSVVGDDTYGVRLDSYGMDALVGIAADTTVDATATVDGEESYTQFDIVTETEGTFTIGEKPYTISGDSSVAIWAGFDTDKDTAFGFDSLNGTVSGDFAGEETFINYSTRTSSGNYILVQNDDDFKIVASANGTELHDISSGATLESYGGVSKAYTDTTGDFTFGASDEDDSLAVTVVGDDNVVFDFDSKQYITNIESVDGSLMFSAMDLEFAINGVGVTTDGEFSSVGAYNTEDRGGMLFFHDVQNGSGISTDTPANVWKQIRGENTTVNGNALVLDGDDNGIWISDKTVVDLDEGASLTVSDAGDYTVNTAELTADSGDTFIGLENATDAYIYDENNKIITKKTSTAEIIDNFTHGFDYGTPITSQSAVKELLESGDRDQILSMYFDDTVSADFSEDNGYKNITLGGEYAQSLKFNNDGYNVAVVDEDSRGKKEIFTGNGGDLVVIDDTKAQVSVMSGTGNDTIVSKGENVFVSLTGGKNDLFTPAGNVTVAGYDAKTASGFATSKKNIVSALEDGSIDFADGNLSLDSAKITFENTSEVVALYDRYGDKQLVGFTSQDDLLDARNYDEDIIFVGKGNSTMLGGTANDTILASGGDIVDGGAGRNYIKLPDERTPFDAGTDILLVNGDRDTVENFSAGFGTHDDRIYIDTTATPEFKFDGSNLSVTSGGNLRGILENVANNSDFVEFMAIDDDGYNTKVAVAQENAFIVAGDELADLYYGKNSSVDFSNYTKMLNLDMDNDDGDGIVFYGINSVIAGSGLTTIVGTNGDDTLVAGSGGTRVWSNWGNDLMVGNNSAEKDKETEFFYLAGDGHDTIRNFEFFTTENAKTADKLQLIDNPVTDAFVTDSGDVFLKLEDDDDWLAIEGAQGKMLRVNDFIAKVDDKTVVFDSEVDYFVATGEVATLQVNESAEIWLDDDEDRAFAGDFRVIDATKSAGANTLAGNTDDNTIFGGQGDNSLWGGDGAEGDDVLYGGGGQNAFFYAIGNGSDTIRGANDGDDVVLHGITLEQIANANISADSVEIQFTDGGSVRVEGTSNVTYHLGDGSKFSADHNQGEWNAK